MWRGERLLSSQYRRVRVEDVVRFLKVPREKIKVVMNAVSPAFQPVTDHRHIERVCARYGLRVPFILYVGTIEPRKNLVRLHTGFRKVEAAWLAAQAGARGAGRLAL